MATLLQLLFLLGLAKISISQIKLVPEVGTEEGMVRGTPQKSRAGREYMAFEGIPYAEKPERWTVSKPKGKWEGILEASAPGSLCPQEYPGEVGALTGPMGTEDCLFLNVYTPHLNENKLFPVMAWIHGGAFLIGSGSEYGADYFMDEDIILVTLNYRLGALGFLYFEDKLIPGNLGMKDQALALKWVQRNIHHFGGDPKQVTLFGESAGSASVHLHVLSSMSRGLFQKAIAQSGSALASWAVSPYPRWNAVRFATEMQCPTSNPPAMLQCLRGKDFEEIVSTQNEMAWGPIPTFQFAPVVEVDLIGQNEESAFLIRKPRDMIARREIANPVPLIMGLMKNEGVVIFSAFVMKEPELVVELNNNWTAIAPVAFIYNNRYQYTPNMASASYKIREYYFRDHPISLGTEQRLTDTFSDRFFIHGVHHAIKAHADYAPVYPYLMTFNDGFSILHIFEYYDYDPPTHADDVPFLFPHPLRPVLIKPAEQDFSKKLVHLWASFATTGKPTEIWGPVDYWPTVNRTDRKITWLQLDRRTQLLRDPFCGRVRFWDHLLTHDLRGFD